MRAPVRQQLVRADEVVGEVHWYLARTAAGVVRVDEAARPFHVGLERVAAALQALAERRLVDIEDVGAFRTGESEHLGERIGDAFVAAERQQYGADAVAHHLLGQDLGLRLVERGGRNGGVRSHHLIDGVEAFDHAFVASDAKAHVVAACDAKRPGAHRALAAERGEAGHDLNQRLLRRILGVGGMAKHALGEAIDIVAQELDKLKERGLIAADRGAGETIRVGPLSFLLVLRHSHLLFL